MQFSPKCFPNKQRTQPAALTNRGELIPCCWIDHRDRLKHPTMVKMLKVSKVSDYENVEDIFKTKEWQDFAKNLAEKNMQEIMPVCKQHCGDKVFKKENWIYKDINKEARDVK